MNYGFIALLFAGFLCSTPAAKAQPQASAIDAYFSDYKAGRLSTKALSAINGIADKSSLLEAFNPYLKDSLPYVRAEAYRIIGNLPQVKDNQGATKKYVKKMLVGLGDAAPEVRQSAFVQLVKFNPTAFDRSDLAYVLQTTRRATDRYSLFKLLGFIGSPQLLDTLRKYEELALPEADRWALTLALARLGDSASVAIVSKAVDRATLNSTTFIGLLPDFSYTKSRRVIDQLLEIAVEGKLQCRSMNPSSEALIPCSYYIIPYLCYSIAYFPVEVDNFGELIDEYDTALSRVTSWYKSKRDAYLIQIYSYK